MATPLFRPARFKWRTTHPPSVWTKGEWEGGIVNLSGGEWGHGESVKKSTGFLERGWRIYSYCADKSKDLAHDWAPHSVCVSFREMFASKMIGLKCTIPSQTDSDTSPVVSADVWHDLRASFRNNKVDNPCVRFASAGPPHCPWSHRLHCCVCKNNNNNYKCFPVFSAKCFFPFFWPYWNPKCRKVLQC